MNGGALKEWFARLQPRERAIVVGGAALAVLIILWLGVLRPLHSRSEILRESVAAKQRLLLSLEQLDGPGTGPGPAQDGDQTLVKVVGNSATEHGVELTRSRPDGPNGIQVTVRQCVVRHAGRLAHRARGPERGVRRDRVIHRHAAAGNRQRAIAPS